MTNKRWFIAGCSLALVLGLVALVFTLGGSDPRPGRMLASGPDASSDAESESDQDDEEGSDRSGEGSSSQSGRPSSPGSDSGPDNDPQVDDDGNSLLDDVVEDVTDGGVGEILCTDEERNAIESTTDDMKDDIFSAAEAEKEVLLDSLGLGSLLGGITNAIQQQLNAIDAEAQQAAAEIDSLVDDALDLCEAGGEPLAVFDG